RESLFGSASHRTTTWVSRRNRGAIHFPGFWRRTSHRLLESIFAISPAILTFPAQAPFGDFQAALPTGEIVATARPRFVTVIVPPSSSTSSSNARHLALNSVALNTRCCITLLL